MKRFILSFACMCATLPGFAADLEWFTDVEAAQAKARQENKYVVLDFTGSDWCPSCMKLKSEVFDQSEFAEYANSKVVMVEVDFPRRKQQTPAQQQVNQRLAQILRVEVLPTVVVLDAAGHPLAQTGYQPGGPKPFIENLERILKYGAENSTAAAPAPEPEPPRKPVTFVPIAPATPTRYEQLALKSISGGKDRRVALINNETFAVGDTAKVKVQDTRVEVCCKEIREDSVLITANGKLMELKLGKH
jgi:thioredoxin-related protein